MSISSQHEAALYRPIPLAEREINLRTRELLHSYSRRYQKKEENRRGLRCGSVETCRKAP